MCVHNVLIATNKKRKYGPGITTTIPEYLVTAAQHITVERAKMITNLGVEGTEHHPSGSYLSNCTDKAPYKHTTHETKREPDHHHKLLYCPLCELNTAVLK